MDRGESRYLLGCTFARGGSKGVPGKNIRPLGGRPLIGWPAETALATPEIGRYIVSTDSPEIAAVARAHGAEVPFLRPPELATDTAAELLSWRHAIESLREREPHRTIEALVSLPATSPLRAVADVQAAIRLWRETGADLVLTVTPSAKNPYFNMAVLDGENRVKIAAKPERPIVRRQDAPTVYEITAVAYVAKPEYVLRCGNLLEGDVRAVVVPGERAVDIDTPMDFAFAEFLLSRR